MADYQWGTSFNYDASRDQVNDEWRQKEWDYGVGRDQIEDEWRQKQWDYGVGRDQIEDGRYDSETAYDRAMAMLMQGVMPGGDLLTAAGIPGDVAAALKNSNVPKATGGSGGGKGAGRTDDDWRYQTLPATSPSSKSIATTATRGMPEAEIRGDGGTAA
jgi:hypothetical protein